MIRKLLLSTLALSFSSVVLQASVETSYAIEQINKLVLQKRVKEALALAEDMYSQNSKDSKLAQTYAKLLFWDNQVDKAYSIINASGDRESKLYKQISVAKNIKDIKSTDSADKKIEKIEKLDSFAKSDYDVLWNKMKAYIAKKEFNKALSVAQELERLYPKSIEAKESVARLYFWTKQYRESLAKYNSLEKLGKKSYKKEIVKLENALEPKKVKKVKYAKKRVVKKRKVVKRRVKKSHIVKKKPKKIFVTNDDLQYEVMSSAKEQTKKEYMVGIGYDYFRFSDKRYTDNTKYIEATLPIGGFTLYNRIDDTHRYGLHDIQYSAELYPTMPKPWWGYLSLSFTPSADFYSKYSIGWHQYYDIGSWEFGLGYNYAKYSAIHTNTLIALYTYYFNDNLYFTQTGFYVTSNKSWAISNRLDYKVAPHHKYYISYVRSDSYESDDQISIILRDDVTVDKFQAGCEVPINENYYIGGNVGYEKFDVPTKNYNRKELNIFVRYYW